MKITMTEANVHKFIMHLNNTTKSIGYDDISRTTIKQNISIFVSTLTALFRESLEQGIFPDDLQAKLFQYL